MLLTLKLEWVARAAYLRPGSRHPSALVRSTRDFSRGHAEPRACTLTCVRLSHPYLTRSLPHLLTMTFTTAAFGRSSSWRFEASSYKAAPKGPPSSFVQHDADRTNDSRSRTWC